MKYQAVQAVLFIQLVNLSKVSIAGLSTIRILSMKTNAPPLSVRVAAKETTAVLSKTENRRQIEPATESDSLNYN